MPALAEPNLETLRPPGNPDELVCVGYRPVFKEHVNRAGQKIGTRELTRISNRCNDRILDSNDFAPLAVRHTKDDSSFDPEVIGFVGPYRMGKLGNLKPLAAIEGKVWVYREHLATLKKYPRLSVEFWADENDPGNGYFDPISLLGAETPELDLGVHYAKDKDGRILMRYSRVERFAAMPGGANTAIPSLIESDQEKKTTYGESGGMLTAQDIQQIVAAMVPIVKQQIDEAMAGMKGMQEPEGGDLDGLGDDDLNLDDDPDLNIGDDLDGLDDDELGDDDLDDDELPKLDDELPEGDEPEQPGDDVPPEESDEPSIPSGEDEGANMADEKKPDEKLKKENYAKEILAKYEKQTIELAQTKEELVALKARVDASEAKERRAVRYSKLTELRTAGFVLDIDQELTDTEPLADEAFDRHCTKIVERYQRAPIGVSLPIPKSEKYDGQPATEKRARYSKQATEVCVEAAKAGKSLDYGTVLSNIERNDGKYVPAA